MFKCTSFDLEQDIFSIFDTEDLTTEDHSEEEVLEYLASGIIIDDLPNSFIKKVAKNRNLTKAKKEKNDEFYTQLSDIEKELSHYPIEAFKDKIIYLPMDIAITDGSIKQSKFVTYFQMNAHRLQFKRLIATCLVDKTDGEGRNYYVLNRQTVSYCTPENQANGKSPIEEVKRDDGRIYYKYRLTDNTPTHDYQLDEDGFRYVPVPDTTVNQAITDEDGAHTYKGASGAWDNQMYRFVDNLDAEEYCPSDKNWGSGDFRSEFCGKLFDQADIIVTNPPFSLFRDFMKSLVVKEKSFIILGNSNAVTYKDVFSLIKGNKLWWGATMNGGGQHWFMLPDDIDYSTGKIELRGDGHYYAMIGTVAWYTNCDLDKRHEPIIGLTKEEYEASGVEYLMYDNYDAIDITRCNKIPTDYVGVMGVPITYLGIHNPDQFEILGCSNDLAEPFINGDGKKCSGRFYINGKRMYDRIVIKRVGC